MYNIFYCFASLINKPNWYMSRVKNGGSFAQLSTQYAPGSLLHFHVCFEKKVTQSIPLNMFPFSSPEHHWAQTVSSSTAPGAEGLDQEEMVWHHYDMLPNTTSTASNDWLAFLSKGLVQNSFHFLCAFLCRVNLLSWFQVKRLMTGSKADARSKLSALALSCHICNGQCYAVGRFGLSEI